ncbi:MAG: FAD-dependent oxidoreductase, partial [Alsobacter sp.]
MIEGRRVRVPGVGERTPGLTFRFEGRPVAAAAGETIAAALTAAGEPAFRQTRGDMDRGVFCGMGVCHECLVSADGDTVRACMTPVAAGRAVERHRPRTAQAQAPGAVAQGPCAVDVAVVGAGPAGLSAALAAARAGLSVALVDERKQAGGQYFKQPADTFPLTPRDLDAQ